MMMIQLKKDLLGSVFGEEEARSLLTEVTEAAKEREILHKSLLQNKSKLQVSSLFTSRPIFNPSQRVWLNFYIKLL